MPSRGQSLTLTYTAWNTSTNAPEPADTANHTLYWCKDGVTAATTNSPAGVTSPADVGESTITLTAAECTANFGKLSGSSSTANVVVIPVAISFEQLPTATPATSGGLPTVDASNGVLLSVGTGDGQVNLSAGKIPATLAAADVSGDLPADAKAINAISTSTVTTINANIGTTQPVAFTGSGASALVKTDVIDVAGGPATPGTPDVNVASYATGQDPATLLAASTTYLGAVAAAVWAALTSVITTAGSIGLTLKNFLSASTPQTGDSFARLGAPAGASVSADIAALKAEADAIKAKTDTSAQASQIPANFTNACFASAGVFSASALQNAPTGSGGGVSLLQLQGELDTRGLTSTFTTTTNTNLTDVKSQADKLTFDGSNNVKSTPQTAGTLTSAYDAAKTAAQAAQIPANFTSATFESPGVFSVGALQHAGGGGGTTALHSGTAQGGTANTITLDAGASSVDGTYVGDTVALVGNTGVGQSAVISRYVGSTKGATVTTNWATIPDNTTSFAIYPLGAVLLGQFAPGPRTVNQDYLGVGNLTVVAPSGLPIKGATVTAYLFAAYAAEGPSATVIASTTTDASGHWSLSLNPASYTITFTNITETNLVTIVVP